MKVSGYTLDLYCDNTEAHVGSYDTNGFPKTYVGEGQKAYSIAHKNAKNAGWLFKKDGTHICPECVNKIKN